MSQLDRVREPQKLFKYAIENHIKRDANERISFYRMNRWRFNTFNRVNILKFLRLKGPIAFSIGTAVIVNYTCNFYDNPAHH